jgi:hypothetical protein
VTKTRAQGQAISRLNFRERRIHETCVVEAIEQIVTPGSFSRRTMAAVNQMADRLFTERTGRVLYPRPTLYGLTSAERKQRRMLPCEICGREATSEQVNAIDHDHVSGALRGTLCRACNTALGLLRDNPDTADRAASYLRKWCAEGPANGR